MERFMNPLITLFSAAAITFVHAAPLSTPGDSQQLQEWDAQNFLNQLQGQIQKQQQLVSDLQKQVARKDVIYPASINNQFENAYTMLNVKKTLYANFANTPSIQSPLVQAKLLQIFQKDLITPADLAELESLVQQERPKYVHQKPQPQPAPK
jgi:hypothetical protein